MTANVITISRMLFSAILLAFSPRSFIFAVLYLLCGATDVLDGFVARRMHTQSEKGARLDSAADLFFAVVYAVKILPLLPVPLWIWIWTAILAIIKITGIVIASRKAHRFMLAHSFENKLMGILLFLLPISAFFTDVKYAAIFVCIAATPLTGKEIIQTLRE